MKLEDAVKKVFWYSEDRKAVGSVREVGVDEFEAILALLSHAESTRWRKLEEENPEHTFREYEVLFRFTDGTLGASHLHWHNRMGQWSFGQHLFDVVWWRPIVGPEEES